MDSIKSQIDFDSDKNATGSDLSQSVWDLIENDEREQLPIADKGLRKCPPAEEATKPLEFVPIPGLDQRLAPSSGKNDELEQLSKANKELRTIKCPPAEPGGKSGGPGGILGGVERPLPPGSRPTEPGSVEPLLERILEKPNAKKELESLSNRPGSATSELERISGKQNAMKALESLSTKVGVAETLLERIAGKPNAMKQLESLSTKPGAAETLLEKISDKSKPNAMKQLESLSTPGAAGTEPEITKPTAAISPENVQILKNREAVKDALKTFMAGDNRSPVPSVKPEPSGPGTPSGDHPIVDIPRPRGR